MEKRLVVLLLPLLTLGCALRAVAPGNRIAKSSQDFNLQIEEAQNKNLLINVWRAKKRYPLYLTDTSKVTGSLTNTYVLGLTIPINKPATGTVGPNATFTQNPTFDVNVLDTQDFMRGFLTPVAPTIFAYYLRQGWPPELLIHLMVREISIEGSPGLDEHGTTTTIPYYFKLGSKTTQRLRNYPDPAKKNQDELEEFSKWARYLAGFHLATCQNNFLKGLTTDDFSAIDSATKALMSGLNIVPADAKKSTTSPAAVDAPSKKTNKVSKTFTGSAKSPSSTTTEESSEFSKEETSGQSYNAVVPFDILVDNLEEQRGLLNQCQATPGKLTIHINFKVGDAGAPSVKEDNSSAIRSLTSQERDTYMASQLIAGSKAPRVETGLNRPDDKEASIQVVLSVVETDDAGQPKLELDDADKQVTARRNIIMKLSLRSPEAILYYLGELARLEEYHSFTQRACINGFSQPIFVAYSESAHPPKCTGALTVEDSEDRDVFIPPSCDPNNERESDCRRDACNEEVPPPVEQAGRVLVFNGASAPQALAISKELQCNGGRSMHSLNLLSQLIALQKSAKDFPTTPTVRVIGQ